jgi:hypothetical protein
MRLIDARKLRQAYRNMAQWYPWPVAAHAQQPGSVFPAARDNRATE